MATTDTVPSLKLRTALPTDLPVLRLWDTRPHVIAASGVDDPFDWETELAREADWQELLIAEIGSRPIGVIQIIDPAREETGYWGRVEPDLRAIDIWIGEEADLGKGYGTVMMRLALDRCFSDAAVSAVLIDPIIGNVAARRFYERLGFKAMGQRWFGADQCMVYRLQRDAWRHVDQDH